MEIKLEKGGTGHSFLISRPVIGACFCQSSTKVSSAVKKWREEGGRSSSSAEQSAIFVCIQSAAGTRCTLDHVGQLVSLEQRAKKQVNFRSPRLCLAAFDNMFNHVTGHALVWTMPDRQEVFVRISEILDFEPRDSKDFDRGHQYVINPADEPDRYYACILLLGGKLKCDLTQSR